MPAGSEPRRLPVPPAAHLAAARRADRRRRSSAGCCCVVVRLRLVRLRRRDPRQVHAVPARHAGLPRAAGLRRVVRAGALAGWSPTPDRLVGGQRLPHAASTSGPRSSRCTLPPGAPWATLDLSDGTTVSAMGIQGSDGARARRAVRDRARASPPHPLLEAAQIVDRSERRRRPRRSPLSPAPGCPRTPRARRPARPRAPA